MARAEEAAEAEEAPAEEAAPAAGETLECDVCVVGCGAAGFMASITAAQNGAKVITLEKGADVTAPNGVYVSGPFAVDTDVLHNREGGTTLTVDDVFYHVMDYTHWTPNPSLMRKCLDAAKDAVAVLEGIGDEFQEQGHLPLPDPVHQREGRLPPHPHRARGPLHPVAERPRRERRAGALVHDHDRPGRRRHHRDRRRRH